MFLKSVYKSLSFSFFFLIFLVLPFCANASVSDLENRFEEYGQKALVEEAEHQDVCSQYILGHAYLNGYGDLEVDYPRAYHWFENAAENGSDEAYYYMGLMLAYGRGVDSDVEQGMLYLEKSAESGVLEAQKDIAEAYMVGINGDVSVVDESKAAYWSGVLADNGDPLAMQRMSIFYKFGRGVEKNENEAFKWIRRAVDKDYILAFDQAGDFYAQGIGTDQDLVRAYMMYDLGGTASSGKKAELAEQMTQAQIDEAVSLSRQWQDEHNSYRPSYHGLEAQGSDGHYEYH
ncbi:tetratricopeptide repeat protein [Salinicola aestuarinus]|uniref:tetratricopeptide repeat protein n=1 Tax=Salinicola aestuarinus TaxID=1949082 RepID=UPI000DA16F32|nr:tetratricopeptide repeat protein [Salinicola aestuarinus]